MKTAKRVLVMLYCNNHDKTSTTRRGYHITKRNCMVYQVELYSSILRCIDCLPMRKHLEDCDTFKANHGEVLFSSVGCAYVRQTSAMLLVEQDLISLISP